MTKKEIENEINRIIETNKNLVDEANKREEVLSSDSIHKEKLVEAQELKNMFAKYDDDPEYYNKILEIKLKRLNMSLM